MLRTADSGDVEVAEQVQLYAPYRSAEVPTRQHCAVVPSWSAPSPPLLLIAGDMDVVRDEIVYTCVPLSRIF